MFNDEKSDHTCENTEEFARVSNSSARVERMDGDGPQGPLRIFKGSLPYPG